MHTKIKVLKKQIGGGDGREVVVVGEGYGVLTWLLRLTIFVLSHFRAMHMMRMRSMVIQEEEYSVSLNSVQSPVFSQNVIWKDSYNLYWSFNFFYNPKLAGLQIESSLGLPLQYVFSNVMVWWLYLTIWKKPRVRNSLFPMKVFCTSIFSLVTRRDVVPHFFQLHELCLLKLAMSDLTVLSKQKGLAMPAKFCIFNRKYKTSVVCNFILFACFEWHALIVFILGYS